MPRIHTYSIPIFLDPIPIEIPRPIELLRRPGMAGCSVLFHARQFDPLPIRTISTAADKSSAYNLADAYLRLIRKRVRVDDGIIAADQTVVLAVKSILTDIGISIGGNTAGDRWEVQTVWTFLLDPDYDQR